MLLWEHSIFYYFLKSSNGSYIKLHNVLFVVYVMYGIFHICSFIMCWLWTLSSLCFTVNLLAAVRFPADGSVAAFRSRAKFMPCARSCFKVGSCWPRLSQQLRHNSYVFSAKAGDSRRGRWCRPEFLPSDWDLEHLLVVRQSTNDTNHRKFESMTGLEEAGEWFWLSPCPHNISLALNCRFLSKNSKVNSIYLNTMKAHSEAGWHSQ